MRAVQKLLERTEIFKPAEHPHLTLMYTDAEFFQHVPIGSEIDVCIMALVFNQDSISYEAAVFLQDFVEPCAVAALEYSYRHPRTGHRYKWEYVDRLRNVMLPFADEPEVADFFGATEQYWSGTGTTDSDTDLDWDGEARGSPDSGLDPNATISARGKGADGVDRDSGGDGGVDPIQDGQSQYSINGVVVTDGIGVAGHDGRGPMLTDGIGMAGHDGSDSMLIDMTEVVRTDGVLTDGTEVVAGHDGSGPMTTDMNKVVGTDGRVLAVPDMTELVFRGCGRSRGRGRGWEYTVV